LRKDFGSVCSAIGHQLIVPAPRCGGTMTWNARGGPILILLPSAWDSDELGLLMKLSLSLIDYSIPDSGKWSCSEIRSKCHFVTWDLHLTMHWFAPESHTTISCNDMVLLI